MGWEPHRWFSCPPDELVWCLHCERVAPRSEWGQGYDAECPYEGCDGHFMDDWPWLKIQHANPDYDLKPVRGVVYPLYPTRAQKRRAVQETRAAKLNVV